MSYLLETLGRGLLGQLLDAFERQLPAAQEDDAATLAERLAVSPGSTDLAMRLGLANLKQMRLLDARAAFERALRLAASPLQPSLGLACVFDELGQLREALGCLRTSAEHDPTDPAIAFATGFCHERLHETDAAIRAYERAIALCPQLRNAHERLAAIAVWRREWTAARQRYATLAELDPGDIDVLMTHASLHLQTGDSEQAVKQFEQALLIEPACFEGVGSDPIPADDADSLENAIAAVRGLVEKYPGVADFHLHLADLHVRNQDDERAVEQYEAAIEAQPGYLEATIKLGTQHLRKERFGDAARTFNRAVELNDRIMTAFAGLALAQHTAGRRREAGGSFDLAASLEPNSALLFAEATRLHLKSWQGDPGGLLQSTARPAARPSDRDLPREVLRRHRQALDRRPDHADLHYRYGLLLRQAGRFDHALNAFRNAVRINPGYLRALVKLAICLHEAGEFEESIATFRRALTLDEQLIDSHYKLGLMFATRHQFDLTVEHFEQTDASHGRNPAVRQNLALALQNIGMVDRASATWRSLCELSREADAGLDAGTRISAKLE